jgi:cytochrome subunit of sulfide dehydrogenase
MHRKSALALFACLSLSALPTFATPTEDLARTCNGCHGVNGVSVGPSMPSIGGLPEAYLKNLLLQWKTGERYAATMDRHVKGYSDAELEALATYFSKLPWVPVVQKADAKIVAQGKDASERCETCHGATGSEPDDEETPKLNGQWAEYMHLEMLKYRLDAVKMPHKKMRSNAKKMDEADVAAVAKFYGAQAK